MRRTLLSLLLLLGLLLVPSAAFAQDDVCTGELDPEGEFLTMSEEAMLDVFASHDVITFDVSLINAPQLPAELVFNLGMEGSTALSPEIGRALTELVEGDDVDPEAMVEEMFDLLIDLYGDLRLDMNADVSMSDDLGALIAGSSGVPASMVPAALNVPFRMVDGFFYANLDDIGEQFEGSGVSGWVGFDLAGMMAESLNMSLEGIESAGSDVDPMEMMTLSMGNQMELQVAMGETAKEYTTITALGASEVDGAEVCEVEYTFDLAGFVSSPAFIEMMVDQVEAQMEMQAAMGGEEVAMTDEDMEMITSMLPMFAPMLLSDLEFSTVSAIGLEDGLVRSSDTRVEWDLGSVAGIVAAMAAPGTMPEMGTGADAPFFSMHITSTTTDFNEEFDVEVPDPVEIIPLEVMMDAQEQ